MPTTYTPTATWHSPIDICVDGDAANAANLNLAAKDISDRTQYLYEKIDVEHSTSTGGHQLITVTPTASGQIGVDVAGHSSDTTSQVKLRLKTSSGTERFAVSQDEARHAAKISAPTFSVPSGNTMTIDVPSSGTSTVAVGNSGSGVCDLTVDGKVRCGEYALSANTSRTFVVPVEAFIPQGTYTRWNALADDQNDVGGFSDADTTSRYATAPLQMLEAGDVITAVTMRGYMSDTLAELSVSIHRRLGDSSGTLSNSTATISGVTGSQTASASLSHTVDLNYGYFVKVKFKNGGGSYEAGLQDVVLSVTRSKVQ